jgi:hypothetical protein
MGIAPEDFHSALLICTNEDPFTGNLRAETRI